MTRYGTRTNRWIFVLMALVFAIGWTSRLLADRNGPAPEPSATRPAWDRDGRGSRDRHGRGGPRMSSLERFADELELRPGQRDQIDDLMAELEETVRGHERSIWEAKHEVRPRMLAILDEDQRNLLDELIRDRWEQYRQERLQRTRDLFAEDFRLDAETLAAVMAVLADYEEQKGSYFGDHMDREQWPDREQVETDIEKLRERRDRRLAELLNEDQMQRYADESSHHRRGRTR